MEPKDYAESMVRTAYELPGETAIRIDVGTFQPEGARAIFNIVLELADSHKVRVRGVRTDVSGFEKLDIKLTTGNSGTYKGVPVVVTQNADFDTMEFVFQPRRK